MTNNHYIYMCSCFSTKLCYCRSSVFLCLEQLVMNQSLTLGSKFSEMLFVCSSLISRGFLRLR